jgi:3-oxoacyl-ACP reductase-like protein
MSIFGSIMSKLTEYATAAGNVAAQAAAAIGIGSAQAAEAPAAAPAPAPAPLANVDVEKILTALAAKSGQPSNWRVSIVDLMKLLGLDSSLAHRKELATELGYTGALDGSAEMNIWLHKQVMQKLAANGGTVPAELKD